MSRLLTGVLLGVTLLGAIALGPSAPAAFAQETTAPSGPTLNPPTEEEAADSRQKLVITVTALVLLGLVVYGNRVRRKRVKKK
ncbi:MULTISPECIES: hypothetical protein [Actinokineospora]|uniref:LPXTG cell wall anchor domain-containing protein n=1 Tax=Actinokineospora fastidiosa TaxID=1816 RepID=A0A918G8W2_9PSEU|nr:MULTISPECIES: hypothetical protein [Actinokineospora]UVS81803.1 hypothetical protein Actkin_05567 [Actinokineospora sp. UTMC 2448]GGS25196.1 hypothetical protein GCM10010171_18120 [Actinokineospora fastidiosa]